MALDFTSPEKALASLEKAVLRTKKSQNDEELKSAVIQRFECCYELSWKMIKRRLKEVHPSPQEVDELSFKDLIREAARRSWLDEPKDWFVFREDRNRSSHTYDEKTAMKVFQTALAFLPKSKDLLNRLKK